MPAGLLGLLQQIPTDGAAWTRERRDEFLRAFTAVLDFTVPLDVGDGDTAIGVDAGEEVDF